MGATLPVINEIPSVTFFEALDILGKSHNQFDLDPTDEVKKSVRIRKREL